MTRIDNPEQLLQLRIRYAVAVAAQQTAETHVRQFMEAVAVLTGLEMGQGDRVQVDWDTGEVHVQGAHDLVPNGVAA